eukprot:TRINITY_DN2892_c1_g1_i3.p1 TRINITY_DN2892_c1_g1~~TRINITY_DN2892_c1_g1_i3.p1  ORF type:complete len:105 (+),score=15.91 TRINITY_DN2892_c1_g1_i3:298-612(+)
MEEFLLCLNSQKKDSAPGPDQCRYTIIKHLPHNGKLVILDIVNKWWEGTKIALMRAKEDAKLKDHAHSRGKLSTTVLQKACYTTSSSSSSLLIFLKLLVMVRNT